MGDRFVYVIYIRATAEAVWEALTKPEKTRAYWCGVTHDCSWRVGAPWRLMFEDGRVGDAGEVVEVAPPRRLALRWRNEFRPELKAEGFSLARFDIEDGDGQVKLTVTHEIDAQPSQFIAAVSGGWPKILSSLKSMLETGRALSAA